MTYKEPEFWVEYNLHKDGSWCADGFHTEEEREEAIVKLKELGYHPRRQFKACKTAVSHSRSNP